MINELYFNIFLVSRWCQLNQGCFSLEGAANYNCTFLHMQDFAELFNFIGSELGGVKNFVLGGMDSWGEDWKQGLQGFEVLAVKVGTDNFIGNCVENILFRQSAQLCATRYCSVSHCLYYQSSCSDSEVQGRLVDENLRTVLQQLWKWGR